MMMTFVLFFAFVINVGMLVNAKINLQNAADLAAYAGASVQARQLTQISYLNYEMRRQWKKFLFRIFVLGPMSLPSYQNLRGGNTPMQYFQGNNPSGEFPATCMNFSNEKGNPCQVTTLSAISQIQGQAGVDQITDVLNGQLLAIDLIRQANCTTIGMANKLANIYWLFNTDPNLTALNSLPSDQSQLLQNLIGAVTGLGIVPREILLQLRIQNLLKYLNQPGQTISKGQVQTWAQSAQDPTHERSIQAFDSAYYTLGNHTFDADSISLTELLPQQLVDLTPIYAQPFDTFAVDMQLTSAAINPTANSQLHDCTRVAVPISYTQKLNVGYSKNPSVLTYYAVRLNATARLLFSPFGDMQLSAYSATQPFGSRIGPSDALAQFTGESGYIKPSNAELTGYDAMGLLPNLPVLEGDSSERGSGWDTQGMILGLLSTLRGANSGSLDTQALFNAYTAAMMPNPWETKLYNIINDGQDNFVRNFDTGHLATIWAPLFPPNSSSQEITQSLQTALGATSGATGGFGPVLNILVNNIQNYVGLLSNPGGVSERSGQVTLFSEGVNYVRILDPFYPVSPSADPGVAQLVGGNSYLVSNPKEVKTSWDNPADPNLPSYGRVGYSVKFVPLGFLSGGSIATDGHTQASNLNFLDDIGKQDVPFLQH